MPIRQARAQCLIIALTLFTLNACSGGSLTTPSMGPQITQDLGATARDEVEAAVSALTLQTTLTPIGTAKASGSQSTPCVVSSTPDDTDGDGVPDEAIYSFAAPPCRFTGWRGGNVELVGRLQIGDPAPTVAGFGYEATLMAIRTRFTGPDPDVIYDVTRSGARVLSGSVGQLLLTSDLQVRRTFQGNQDATIDEKWNLGYTPASQLQINGPLNSGTISITGTWDWSRADESLSLTVTTPTPLEYDAGCTDTVQRIKNGEMHLAGKFGDIDGFVRLRWSGCGKDPSVGFGTGSS
jgi:hypothetical protein